MSSIFLRSIGLGIAFCVISSCQRSEFDFTATQLFGETEVTVGLKSVSAFAEYKKFVIIKHRGKQTIRHEMFMDTGGYSAVRIHETATSFVIIDLGDDAIEVDKRTGSVQMASKSKLSNIAPSNLVGEFNFDPKDRSSYKWFGAIRT